MKHNIQSDEVYGAVTMWVKILYGYLVSCVLPPGDELTSVKGKINKVHSNRYVIALMWLSHTEFLCAMLWTDFLYYAHCLSYHQCFYHWNKWPCWSRSALHSRGNIMSLSSAGFRGNAQLSLPSAHNIAGMYWMRPHTPLENICLFHLVSEGLRKNNVLNVSALCIKVSFM